MKYLKYIVLSTLVVSLFSCQKFETPVFTDKPSFEFQDTVLVAPVGFISDGIYTQKIVIKIFGRLPENDIQLKLKTAGSAQNDRDYKLTEEITFPKGASEVTVDFEIFNSPELSKLGDRDLLLTIESSVESVTGIRPQSRVKIEIGVPSQWIGYSGSNFDGTLGKCTKAKYQYFYKTLGFYDFTKAPGYGTNGTTSSFIPTLRNYVGYLNSKINDENEVLIAAGKDTLKDDDGSELVFKP